MEDTTRRDNKATLGCGTMILIALIVLIFGNVGNDNADHRIEALRQDVKRLQETVSAQTQAIEGLKRTLTQAPKAGGQEPKKK
jgi:hypothetical protein